MAITRLGADGYGVRRAGSFAGKGALRGVLTRMGAEGYGVRRMGVGAFGGKTPTAEDATQVSEFVITVARRRRGR